MVTEITVRTPPELKRLACEEADRAGVPLSEWAATVLAERLQRPDLAVIPRKKPGRPRKELPPSVPA